MDSGSARDEGGRADAQSRYDRRTTKPDCGVFGDAEVGKEMATDSIAVPLPRTESRSVVLDWLCTVDHKKIGIMYIVYALIFLVIMGCEAILMRIQLARPESTFLSAEAFNRLFAMPILLGFGNYYVPLMIGARDMAFPRLNAFSFWMTAFGGIFLYASFFTGG